MFPGVLTTKSSLPLRTSRRMSVPRLRREGSPWASRMAAISRVVGCQGLAFSV